MKSENVKIRLAMKSDIPWLIKNIRHLRKSDAVHDIQKQRIMVAVVDRKVVGCLRLESWGLWFSCVSTVKVEENFRRLGIGRMLLQFTENRLYQQGKRILLSSSTQGEKLSSDWHRKVGFKKSGRFKSLNGLGIDEIFYIKKIKIRTQLPIGKNK